jgi:hypothetical protein
MDQASGLFKDALGLASSFKNVEGYKTDPCYASTTPGSCNEMYGNSRDVAGAAT